MRTSAGGSAVSLNAAAWASVGALAGARGAFVLGEGGDWARAPRVTAAELRDTDTDADAGAGAATFRAVTDVSG